MKSVASSKLADAIKATVTGPTLEIYGVTSLHYPRSHHVIPILGTGKKNRELIESAIKAGNCFLTTSEIYAELQGEQFKHTWLLVPSINLYEVFISLLTYFDTYHTPQSGLVVETIEGKVSEKSRKDLTAIGCIIAENVFLGPQVVIGRDTRIESGAILHGQNYLGYEVTIGRNTQLHPQVTVHHGTVIGENSIIHSGTVLGSDGFGYHPNSNGQGLQKIPQIGNVVIGDSVEIGSNCSVDRATLNSTRIGNRVKIDNLVQIGHNVEVGDDTIIISLTGIGGSVRIGKQVVLGGQVGIADHVIIGDRVKIASKSAIFSGKNIPPGSTLRGIPAIKHIQQNRIDATLRNLIKKNLTKRK